MGIETSRLLLVPATLASLQAELRGPTELASVIRMEVSEEWPPELYDPDPIEFTIKRLEAAPQEALWWLYYFVRKATEGHAEGVIGCGGYKGPPTGDGTVEIGYSVVPQHRRAGYATEAAQGLIRHAFRHAAVQRVIAETLPGLVASIGVLEKCGFHCVGDGAEPGVIRYEFLREEWEERSGVATGS